MDLEELTEICRLCPRKDDLVPVFDESISKTLNMKEIILVMTGIEVLEKDLISRKICRRCSNIALNMFQFRQSAIAHHQKLKKKCNELLLKQGVRLPNTNIIIKKEKNGSRRQSTSQKESAKVASRRQSIHPSLLDIYRTNPQVKLPKKCFERHMTPVVSLKMGEVENWFKNRNLDMRKFIFRPTVKSQTQSSLNKQKTVAPIKISKIFEGHKNLNNSPQSDFYSTEISHEVKKRKISTSSEDNKEKRLRLSSHNSKVEESIPVSPQSPPSPWEPVSEESSECSGSNKNIEDFEPVESSALTPTVTTKSQTLLVCRLCDSLHNNAFELKRHTLKHMICQFCKVKFKSLQSKDDHVENSCQVKNIMNSSGPIVKLERVHLNLEIRKKYANTFSNFDPLPGLDLAPVEQIILQMSSHLLQPTANDVIVLSDDEESHLKVADPLSTPSSFSVTDDVAYSTVSIVRPEIRIKNNTYFNNINNLNSSTDVQLIKDMLKHAKPKRTFVEKTLQTDLPSNRDIKINNSEGTCELKNLKEHLKVYKVATTITNGNFNVGYNFKNNSKPDKKMDLWNDVSVIDKQNVNTDSNLAENVQDVTPAIPDLVPISSTFNIHTTAVTSTPTLPSVFSEASTSKVSKQIPSNSVVTNVSLNSATPLLQNYALSISNTPVVTRSIPLPKMTPINSFVSSNSSSTSVRRVGSPNRTMSNLLTPSSCNTTSSMANNTGTVLPSSVPYNISVPALGAIPSVSNNISSPVSSNSTNLVLVGLPSPIAHMTMPSSTPFIPQSIISNSLLQSYNNPPPLIFNSNANTFAQTLSSPSTAPPILSNIPLTNGFSDSTRVPPVLNTAPNVPSSQAITNIISPPRTTTMTLSEPKKFRVKNVWELQ